MSAQHITHALRGTWYRRYGVVCCPAHQDRSPSLTLADGADGRLLLNCKAGCDFIDVLNALRGLGVVEGNGSVQPRDPAELARREAEDRAEVEKRAKQASAVWKEAVPIKGTLAEDYLRGRGITCDLPKSLRFHPDCWHLSGKRFPAMVAAVQGPALPAIHRTYLDGSAKAQIDPNKVMLGRTAGGAVRVSGTEGPLVVAEGIETALSLASGLLSCPATIWACLSTSGLAGLRLPDRPHRLTIATDGDAPGKEAGRKLAERATALGWRVSILPAPDGRDWNDVLMLKGRAAA